MSEFIRGPWEQSGCTVYALCHDGWRKGVEQFRNRFTAHVQDAHTDIKELEATACLIASSPDMYDAIKAALCDDPDWRRLCVDALAKAEGRT